MHNCGEEPLKVLTARVTCPKVVTDRVEMAVAPIADRD
jgi:hypothetical protein